jgi:GNAT superfamily N-acetyltransferase
MAMTFALQAVVSDADWRAMHDIRLATLFSAGRHDASVVYDENHPDDRDRNNQCFLLHADGEPAGVVRLDGRGAAGGVVRLVAIVPGLQGRGYGRAMNALIEAEARRRGMTKLVVNAHESAVGFYERTGWSRESWDPSELTGIASRCVQMSKPL